MRLSNIEIPNDGDVPSATHHAFICVTHGGFTRHSAEYCAAKLGEDGNLLNPITYDDPKIVKNVALKFRLPSSNVPTNWNSPGIINVAAPGGRGKMVDRIGLRVLNTNLTDYDVPNPEGVVINPEWTFTLTLVCEDSAL